MASNHRVTMAQTIAQVHYACVSRPDPSDKYVKELLKLKTKELEAKSETAKKQLSAMIWNTVTASW